MLNPENKPTTRVHIFPDGRSKVVPTSEGLRYTKSEKKRKRMGNLNSEEKRKNEEEQSVIWNQVRPLYERGLLNDEIVILTDLSRQQVMRSIGQNKYRPTWNKVRTRRDNSRRIGAWELRKKRDLPLSEDKKRSIEFIKFFVSSDLITKDTSAWKELKDLYARSHKALPKSNFDKLRLEVFLMAIQRRNNRDLRLLTLYNKLGSGIGKEWFEASLIRDQSFIIRGKDTTSIDSPGFSGIMYSDDDDHNKRAMIRRIVAQGKHAKGYA
jgi:hypothetical protein